MFIYTENYNESHEAFKLKIYNTKHTQNTQIHLQQAIFPKIHKFGVSWASPDSF